MYDVAHLILVEYLKYYHKFKRITKRAKNRFEYREFASHLYYHVAENDVFPEEFACFLAGNADIRKIFSEMHGDLFKADYWKTIQKRLEKGDIIDVYPYSDQLRFVNVYVD